MVGGKFMDTILDKLSQKLTATEIIKANSEADAKELERIQEQVQQYNDCLEEMTSVEIIVENEENAGNYYRYVKVRKNFR